MAKRTALAGGKVNGEKHAVAWVNFLVDQILLNAIPILFMGIAGFVRNKIVTSIATGLLVLASIGNLIGPNQDVPFVVGAIVFGAASFFACRWLRNRKAGSKPADPT